MSVKFVCMNDGCESCVCLRNEEQRRSVSTSLYTHHGTVSLSREGIVEGRG